MAGRPAISQSVAFLRDHFVARGKKLQNLRFRLTINPDRHFTIYRVDDDNHVLNSLFEEGILTSDTDWQTPGVYFLRPDEQGKFHPETLLSRAIDIIRQEAQQKGSKCAIKLSTSGFTYTLSVFDPHIKFEERRFAFYLKDPALKQAPFHPFVPDNRYQQTFHEQL